jgi:hypothetical protein
MAARRDLASEGNRETEPRWSSGRGGAVITTLAAIGAVNLALGLYNAGYLALMDGTVAEQPSWLALSAP